MNRGDLRTRCFQISVVDDYVVGHRGFFGQRQLRSDSGVSLFAGEPVTRQKARPLYGLVGPNHDEGRKSPVGARLNEERRLIEDVRSGAILEAGDVLSARRRDQGVQYPIELRPGLLIFEHHLPESFSVQAPLRVEHLLTKRLHDARQTPRPRLDDFTREIVSVDHRNAEVAEHLRDGGLATCDPTRQPHNRFHPEEY